MHKGRTVAELTSKLSSERPMDYLNEWIFMANKCQPDKRDDSFLKYFVHDGKLRLDLVQTRIHNNAGPDVAVLVQHISNPNRVALLVIQCKVADKLEIVKSIKNLDPCTFLIVVS